MCADAWQRVRARPGNTNRQHKTAVARTGLLFRPLLLFIALCRSALHAPLQQPWS